jgi:hypothetical protein
MNKASIILIIIIAVAVGYTILHYTGNTNSIEEWFAANITPTFNQFTSQITGVLNGINTFIKENPWFAPIMTVCGSLTAAGIWNVLKNRSTETKISTIQNQNMETQNQIIRGANQTVSAVQAENQTLKAQVTEYQQQLASTANNGELQALIEQKNVQLKSFSDQIGILQTTIKQLKPAEVTAYK